MLSLSRASTSPLVFRSAAAAASLGCMLITGCSASVGVGANVISKADVEQGTKGALTKIVGKAPQSVTCPSDLDAKVGATERCTLTDGATTLGLSVTVKSVDSDSKNAQYEVAVDGPSPSAGGTSGSPASDAPAPAPTY